MNTTLPPVTQNTNGNSGKDAIELLESQHRAVEKLFSQIENERAVDTKSQLFKRIADSLAIHAAIEEHSFYPAVKQRRTRDILLESLEEHLGIKRLIADMLDVSVTEPIFDAKLKTLKELVKHHVGEEERTLFPKVRNLFSTEELQEIADTMLDEQLELDGTEPRLNIRWETATAALLP